MKRTILRILAKAKMAFYRWVDEHTCSVLIDGSDNSVSMSKGMIKAVGIYDKDIEGALIVKTSGGQYGIVFKEKDRQEHSELSNVANIQYNSKYKSIGFETLTPMANRILDDYGLPIMSKQKFSVKLRKSIFIEYWEICRKK